MIRLITYCKRVQRRALLPDNQARLRAVGVEDDPLAVIEGAHLRLDAHAIQNFPKSFSGFFALLSGYGRGRHGLHGGSESEAGDGRRQGGRYFGNADSQASLPARASAAAAAQAARRARSCRARCAVGFGAGFARARLRLSRPGGRFALPAFPDFPDVREGRALAIGVLRYCRPRAPSTTLPPSELENRAFRPLPSVPRVVACPCSTSPPQTSRSTRSTPTCWSSPSATRTSKTVGLLNQAGARVAAILRRAIADERFRAKTGQTLIAHVDGQRTARVALVGLGAAPDPTARALRLAAGSSRPRRRQRRRDPRRARVVGGDARAGRPLAAQAAAEGALLGSYRFEKYLTDERSRQRAPTTLLLRPPASDDATPCGARPRPFHGARGGARARSRQRARGLPDADAARRHRRPGGRATPASPSRSSIEPRARSSAWACFSPSRKAAPKSHASFTSRGRPPARGAASRSSAKASRSTPAACR